MTADEKLSARLSEAAAKFTEYYLDYHVAMTAAAVRDRHAPPDTVGPAEYAAGAVRIDFPDLAGSGALLFTTHGTEWTAEEYEADYAGGKGVAIETARSAHGGTFANGYVPPGGAVTIVTGQPATTGHDDALRRAVAAAALYPWKSDAIRMPQAGKLTHAYVVRL